MPELPSGTVTFLFTDIEGSTRLLSELGDGYAAALAEHRRVVRETITRRGGVEVDTQGDAFFVAFADAGAALDAAVEAQATLELPVRMGIHTGEMEPSEDGYVGLDVHRAARICAVAHGGQVVLSAATRACVLEHKQLDLSDLGLHRLKDLAEPVRLYQLGGQEFPPLRSLNATRLALQAAAELVDDFPDGLYWVPLAAIREPQLVPPTIEQTLGAKLPLAEHVDEKRTLLLLDNLEQVVACAPALGDALAACPNLRLLVTSRVSLHLQSEREYQVAPLPDPDAVELFCARATNAEPEAAVADICGRLDGLPLAIELAAARTRVLAPDELLRRLEQRLPLLTGGARDAPERQRTLRATIEWSHDLLTPEEQELFAHVAVFEGGFTLDAAEEVCDAELDTLESLVQHSLVRADDKRFTMLETIREFAAERLAASPDVAALRARHAEWFSTFCEARRSLLGSLEDAALRAMDELSLELENIRTALGYLTAVNPERAVRMLALTISFWFRSGRAVEGRRWSERTLERVPPHTSEHVEALFLAGRFAGNTNDPARAEELCRAALAGARGRSDVDQLGRIVLTLGESVFARGETDAAERHFDEALELFRREGDDWGITFALAGLAWVADERDDLDRATALLDQAVAYAEARRILSLPMLLRRVGDLALERGDFARAEQSFRDALELGTRWQQRLSADAVLAGFAAALVGQGDEDVALPLIRGLDALHDPPGSSPALSRYPEHFASVDWEALRTSACDTRPPMSLDEAIDFALSRDSPGGKRPGIAG
jgi:predicted ATPase/class 3 adenylate cyclase